MKRPVSSYQGAGACLFVCYSHAEMGMVDLALTDLAARGLNLWYSVIH